MLNEPRPMREIHEIQEKIYEEYKGLSIKEKVEAINREAKEALKKWGLKLKKLEQTKT